MRSLLIYSNTVKIIECRHTYRPPETRLTRHFVGRCQGSDQHPSPLWFEDADVDFKEFLLGMHHSDSIGCHGGSLSMFLAYHNASTIPHSD